MRAWRAFVLPTSLGVSSLASAQSHTWAYEFWVEEGADAVAEEEARLIIDRLVDYLRSIQVVTDPSRPEP